MEVAFHSHPSNALSYMQPQTYTIKHLDAVLPIHLTANNTASRTFKKLTTNK